MHQKKRVATNQHGGQMMYKRDLAPGQNPHINYEPSMLNGLKEATQAGKEYTPYIEGNLVRESIDRQSNTKQAGETYRNFEQWEREELLENLIRDLSVCHEDIQNAMIALAQEADEEYGRLLKEGLHNAKNDSSASKPLGNINGDQAPQDAMNKGHDAEPY